MAGGGGGGEAAAAAGRAAAVTFCAAPGRAASARVDAAMRVTDREASTRKKRRLGAPSLLLRPAARPRPLIFVGGGRSYFRHSVARA
jgi:hypothetical protein